MSYPANSDSVAADQIKSFVRRIEALEDEIKVLNEDKSEVYKEAKGNGFDTKVLRKVIAARRQDHAERLEQDALFDLYMEALEEVAHAHVEIIEEFDPETGEVSSTAALKEVPNVEADTFPADHTHPQVVRQSSGGRDAVEAGTQAPPVEAISQPADRLAVDAGSDGSTAADASIAIIPEPVVLFPADPLRSGAAEGDEAELPAQETNVKHDGPTHSGEVA